MRVAAAATGGVVPATSPQDYSIKPSAAPPYGTGQAQDGALRAFGTAPIIVFTSGDSVRGRARALQDRGVSPKLTPRSTSLSSGPRRFLRHSRRGGEMAYALYYATTAAPKEIDREALQRLVPVHFTTEQDALHAA